MSRKLGRSIGAGQGERRLCHVPQYLPCSVRASFDRVRPITCTLPIITFWHYDKLERHKSRSCASTIHPVSKGVPYRTCIILRQRGSLPAPKPCMNARGSRVRSRGFGLPALSGVSNSGHANLPRPSVALVFLSTPDLSNSSIKTLLIRNWSSHPSLRARECHGGQSDSSWLQKQGIKRGKEILTPSTRDRMVSHPYQTEQDESSSILGVVHLYPSSPRYTVFSIYG